ncbi:hypothetical protein J3454_10835 [Erythrobacter sp. NFXS35]|uniref:hypothetical protein n=1 Tax=Erythrobacter sp. NFXS35 TaxID=2818436 RepID=UPI0032DF99A5
MARIGPLTISFAALSSALLMVTAMPALADTDKVPPGDPCGSGPGVGKGNPCNGNNGNEGANGNARSGQPEFQEIELPPSEDTGVFISQIGTTNRAEADQGNNRSFTRIAQNGGENTADVTQGASGTHYASIGQTGDANKVVALQEGSGQTVLLLAQQGDNNTAAIAQTDGGQRYSAAAVMQNGNGNSLILVQDGDDNQARLTQSGDDNIMTASQIDNGNRLEWNQIGNGLSDLGIEQTGGSTVQITQSRPGG